MNLGENIYKLRSNKNWSQTDLANELDVSRQSVSKWENNSAVPDLERLIKMSSIFDTSLDDIVFGNIKQRDEKQISTTVGVFKSIRDIVGIVLMVFGMIFFLLSIFWGDHLYFGEAFGELLSIVIVLLSLAMIAPYNFNIISICAVIYFIYTVVCFGIINVTSLTNYLFTFISGALILVWFISYGIHETKDSEFSKEPQKAEKEN